MKKLAAIFLPLLIVAIPFLFKFFFSDPKNLVESPSSKVLKWIDLRPLDYSGDTIPQRVQSILGIPVRIAGFGVTLEDDVRSVREFLLVPSPMACIHVPPPPPNQLIEVELDKEVAALQFLRPVWVEGVLEVIPLEGAFAKQGYRMKANRVFEYQSSF